MINEKEKSNFDRNRRSIMKRTRKSLSYFKSGLPLVILIIIFLSSIFLIPSRIPTNKQANIHLIEQKHNRMILAGNAAVNNDNDPEDNDNDESDPASYSNDEDNDNIDDVIENNNSRDNIYKYGEDSIELHSGLQNQGFQDEIDISIDTEDSIIYFNINYHRESKIDEIDNLEFQYSFKILGLIEFRDNNSDKMFEEGQDEILKVYNFQSFKPISHSILLSLDNQTLDQFIISTQDDVFKAHILFSDTFVKLQNTTLSPSMIKIDFEISNFPFKNESYTDSYLALKTQIELSGDENDFEEIEETEIENEEIKQDPDEIDEEGIAIPTSDAEKVVNLTDSVTYNDYNASGEFTWQKYALIDGIYRNVSRNIVRENNKLMVYFAYPHGTHIYHDPKLGISGILRRNLTPTTPPEKILPNIDLILIILGVLGAIAIISKEDYRNYLLNRVIHINTGFHRLSMEDVLENENRDRILSEIIKSPGIHFNELLRIVKISAGILAWHLDILETYKIIKKERLGKYLIYFPYTEKNPFKDLDPKIVKSKTTLEVFDIIEEFPGVYQREISRKLELNHKTVKYHIDKLVKAGMITSKKEKGKIFYYPSLSIASEDIQDQDLSSYRQ